MTGSNLSKLSYCFENRDRGQSTSKLLSVTNQGLASLVERQPHVRPAIYTALLDLDTFRHSEILSLDTNLKTNGIHSASHLDRQKPRAI